MQMFELRPESQSLTTIDHRLHPFRRLHPYANPVKFVPQQDRKTSHLPSDVHDHLGRHIGRYSRMSEFRWIGGVSLLPGIHRSRILSGMLVLPQRMVYEEGVGSENGGSLLWKFDLGRLRWAHHRGDHE